MSSPWIIGTSCTLFLPALITFFKQSIIVFIIVFNAALYSTLYHITDEDDRYETYDVVFALLGVTIGLVVLALLSRKYKFYNWRVLIPVVFSIIASVIYFYHGTCHRSQDKIDEKSCTESNANYELYHSLWHLLMAGAGTALFWTPVDLKDSLDLTYRDVVFKISQEAESGFEKLVPMPPEVTKNQ